MSERDEEERALRGAFARLREEEARRAPGLAELVARANRNDAARFAWLRLALPLAGAAMASFAWWLSSSAPDAAAAPPAIAASAQPLIALGSLRSPTDALLASPLSTIPRGFSSSVIPSPPRRTPAERGDSHTQAAPARRFSA